MKNPFGNKAVSRGIAMLLSASFVCGMYVRGPVIADTAPDPSGFVDELYTAIAGEVPDTPKVTNIKTALENGSITGIEAAHRIVFSTEGFNANRDDAVFIESMKNAAGNDLASLMGLPTFIFLGELDNTTREDVFEWFVSTHGFSQLCYDHGIEAGEYGDGNFTDPDAPMIALTFDDGPSPYTDTILDCLEEYGQHATFFVVGYNACDYQDQIARADYIGCEIGNHTNGHANLSNLDSIGVFEELRKADKYIIRATGHPATVIRPPYGAYNDTVRVVAGAPLVLWNVDTEDWSTRDTQSTIDNILGVVQDGDIVLMHDIYESTAEAMLTVIPELTAQGYQLVTMSEIADGRGGMEAGGAYFRFRQLDEI
jgi:peptidoglycan/xylan/chitin deacetylase (PgdA/CDA1 family)